ncbi:MAG: 4-(cytidine 5'-diphospho)-2-C-methyl-D-erythritol kinase [Candidatus Firestonebacteria bacterium]
MEQITLKSFAKINLYLEVKGKRPDGYHDIKTVFQTVDLADKVIISRIPGIISLECSHPGVPIDNKNIAFKAAELILSECGIRTGLKIVIDKNIPLTAGLGGGSSNAAAVLNGCNVLFGLNLSCKKLSALAATLGSDVPFLLKGGTALGEGRGEILTELNPVPETWMVLIIEGEKPSTGRIYSEFTKTLTNVKVSDKKLEEFISAKAVKGGELAKKLLYNDLETPAGKFFPVLFKVKEDLLAAGAIGVLMSGSGPSVFGITATKENAEDIAGKLKQKYRRVILTKTIKPS